MKLTGWLPYRTARVSMTASQDSLLVRPTGEAATLVAVVVVLSFFSTVVIFLRIYVRSRIRMFGADDWLMTFGWVSFRYCVYLGIHVNEKKKKEKEKTKSRG